MTTRIVLTRSQREQVDRGRFVRVDVPPVHLGRLGGLGGATPSKTRPAAAPPPSKTLPAAALPPNVTSVIVGRVAGTWRAYVNECRHRALPLDLGASSPMSDDGAYLLCHQHGALYSLIDGRCVLGPCAGEALTPVAIEVVTDDADNAAPRPAGSR